MLEKNKEAEREEEEEEEEEEKVGNADKMVKQQTSAGDCKEAIMQHSAAQQSKPRDHSHHRPLSLLVGWPMAAN